MFDTHPWHRFCFLLLLVLACAKQGFPPGGPEDTTPPEVVRVVPEPGATNVDLRTVVSVGFSEWMEKRSLKESIFISPIPKPLPRIKVKPKRVEIAFEDGLDPNQTYVITVGTGAKDGHGNGLESSWTFAFSTGDRIDTGQISGRVVYGEGSVKETHLWAFAVAQTSQPDPSVDQPDYMTQADASGFYSFSYLSPGQYRLFAFLDTDRDGTYTGEKDPLGVPRGDVMLSYERLEVENRDFILAVRDTTRPECVSVTAVDNIHVDIRFSEVVDLGGEGTIRIKSYEEGLEVPLLILSRHGDHGDQTLCHLVTERQGKGREYEVDVCGIVDLAGNRISRETCLIPFIGSAEDDTLRPVIVATSPVDSAVNVPLDQRITFTFNEALDTTGTAAAFQLATVPGEIVRGRIEWPHGATLVFVPDRELKGSLAFLASLEGRAIRDLAGNMLDTVKKDIFFTTLSADTVGHISGSIADEDSLAEGRLKIQAVNVGDPQSVSSIILSEPGSFELRDLFPGRYTLWAFRDEDGDGAYTYGRPRPILFSERFTWYPDTVEVRSRWETQGIDFILKP